MGIETHAADRHARVVGRRSLQLGRTRKGFELCVTEEKDGVTKKELDNTSSHVCVLREDAVGTQYGAVSFVQTVLFRAVSNTTKQQLCPLCIVRADDEA
jgi:hypothetical protein